MTNSLELSDRLLTGSQAARVNPSCTIKRINVDFLDTLTAERGTSGRSSTLDQILDELRTTYTAARAERASKTSVQRKSALPGTVDKALRLASQRSGQSVDQIIASALIAHLDIEADEVAA